ncbi:hypothetical protein FB45DRAFT_1071116 [Roridomyces roridus]|uniref:Uncharacterized protein n=1 Tax=Roridomyces roridus TaxID=1738132 RepID=A0AAD7AXY9_9AGAR|nr:hypothetical protein FB45DRAFT_1071116 [Roridomyces roridus]
MSGQVGVFQSVADLQLQLQSVVDLFATRKLNRQNSDAWLDYLLQQGSQQLVFPYNPQDLVPYTTQLDHYEQQAIQAQNHGRIPQGQSSSLAGALGGATRPTNQEAPVNPSPVVPNGSGNNRLPHLDSGPEGPERDHRGRSHERRGRRKRHRSPSTTDGSSRSSSRETDQTHKHKKPRLDPSRFGYDPEAEIHGYQDKYRRDVFHVIENYSRDPKEMVRITRARLGCPRFTEVGWRCIVQGEYVDFDAVSLDFYGHAVTTSVHWNQVWDDFEKAMLFVFNDRQQELITYAKYIRSLFTTMPSNLVHNAINCEKAIRSLIGSTRQLLFSDTSEFVQLERAYLIPGMLHYKPDKDGGSEVDNPLPRPPDIEFKNKDAFQTIMANPHLFQVRTEIHTGNLRSVLVNHPNPKFVDSVLMALEEGAWPFADTHSNNPEWPVMWDNSKILPKSAREQQFLEEQSYEEEELGRFSISFGPDLLPGMYSTPVLAVPKPNSTKLRLCSHMSAGKFCQNNMMDDREVKGARLDTLHHFFGALLKYRRSNPDERLVAFKSDVKGAFRLIPSHPLWQIKQVVTTNYPTSEDFEKGIDRGPLVRRVDWRSSFGSRGSPRLWNSVMGLILWAAIFVKMLADLFVYVDDNFGWEVEGRMSFYKSYGKMMPTKQVKLLEFWDWLGVPHSEEKQLWGTKLTIIGFEVDVNEMSITMPVTAKTDLEQAVQDFIDTPSRKRTLHDWHQLSGWVSWSLNVFPLLRPALSNVYVKTSGLSRAHATVHLNQAVTKDLGWFVGHVRSLPGISSYHAVDWDPVTEADTKILCDACPRGMGFWEPKQLLGFYSAVPVQTPTDTIFFWEATTVLAALEWFCAQEQHFKPPMTRPVRLSIYTDNQNTFQIFDSLAAKPAYNELLKRAVDLLIHHRVDLRVLLIPGENNVVADAISRENFAKAYASAPGLEISTFTPPPCALGALKK